MFARPSWQSAAILRRLRSLTTSAATTVTSTPNRGERFFQDAAQRLAGAASNAVQALESQEHQRMQAAHAQFAHEFERTRKLANVFGRSERHVLNGLKLNATGVRGFSSSSPIDYSQQPQAKVIAQDPNNTMHTTPTNPINLETKVDDDDENWAGFEQPLTWGQLLRPQNIPLFMWALDETIGIAVRSRYFAAQIRLARYFSKESEKKDDKEPEMTEAEKKLQEEAKKMKKVWGDIRKGLKTGQGAGQRSQRSRLDPENKKDREKSEKDEKDDDDEPGMPKNIVAVIIGFSLLFWAISSAVSSIYEERLSLVTRKELKALLESGRINSIHIRGTSAEMRLNKAPINDQFSTGAPDTAPYANLKPAPQPTPAEAAAEATARQAAREAVAAAGSPNEVPPTQPPPPIPSEVDAARRKEVERAEARKELLNKYLAGDRVYFGVPSADGAQRMVRTMCQELGLEDPPMVFEEPSVLGPLLLQVAIFGLIFFGASRFFSGLKPGSGPFASMKRNFKAATRPNVTFKDVAGLDQAKVEIMEFVDFLANPHKYKALGARLPKGALLVGPPGTGKTLLAKATAGEAKVPFFSVSGSDFQEMFVGVGSARVRELFKEARKSAPSIIFIDEVDAIGRARARGGTPSHEERENTLNAMLVEMDGFAPSENVVVLAGTNRAELLDKALTRPGRFDRQIAIDAPDIKGRVEIFKVHLKPIKLALDPEEVATKMAALTPGMVGADIANVCNEAALVAARSNKEAVELVDFEKAVDRIIGGLEKSSNILSPEERKLVAYHEAGHAICGWFLEHADPLLKVTIIPRSGGALGFAQYLPKEVSLYRVRQFQDRIAMALGGRAAEQVCFSEISSGASDDIKRTMRMAQVMVARLGMSKELANLCLESDDSQGFTKPFSESTAEIVDAEVKKIIDVQYDRAVELLTGKRELLEKLGSALLEKETLNHDELVAILGPRPFQTDAYVKYMEIQREEKAKRDALAAEAKKAEETKKEEEAKSSETKSSETKDSETKDSETKDSEPKDSENKKESDK